MTKYSQPHLITIMKLNIQSDVLVHSLYQSVIDISPLSTDIHFHVSHAIAVTLAMTTA